MGRIGDAARRLVTGICVSCGVVLGILSDRAMAQTDPKGIIYDCDITSRSQQTNWISPKVAVVVDLTGDVKVIDAVLISFRQSPASATVTRNTRNVLRARWQVLDTRDTEGRFIADMDYTLRLNKQTNRIFIGANPLGFAVRFSGSGTCVPRSMSGQETSSRG